MYWNFYYFLLQFFYQKEADKISLTQDFSSVRSKLKGKLLVWFEITQNGSMRDGT